MITMLDKSGTIQDLISGAPTLCQAGVHGNVCQCSRTSCSHGLEYDAYRT